MALMDHVRYLAETIGPRGSTTPQEEEAARYAAQVLREAGQDPVTETFRSAQSAWYPSALFCGLTLSAVIAFWIGGLRGALVALVLTLLAVASILLELAFRPNPLRWLLPRAKSQNVWVKFAPRDAAGETRPQAAGLRLGAAAVQVRFFWPICLAIPRDPGIMQPWKFRSVAACPCLPAPGGPEQ